MIRVKVCGITNLEDALVAAAAGADALGFNFWPGSPRYLEPKQAVEIMEHLPPFVTPVALFVNEEAARRDRILRRTGARAVQLHGDESAQEAGALAAAGLAVFKAFRVGPRFRPQDVARYHGLAAALLDASVQGKQGGTGKAFDWRRARAVSRYARVVLAGGLTPENVGEAIAQAQPYGVDVCSGVEREPGLKDHDRLRLFLSRAKRARVA